MISNVFIFDVISNFVSAAVNPCNGASGLIRLPNGSFYSALLSLWDKIDGLIDEWTRVLNI